MSQLGHEFLKSLGKTKLRPGGVEATNFILKDFNIKDGTNFLEGACNKGVNLLKLAKKYPNVNFYGVDLSKKAIEEANLEKERLGLTNVSFYHTNLMEIPFDDNFFDYVLVEAVFTMMNQDAKDRVLSEIYRVLKANGKFGNHEITVKDGEDYDYVEGKISEAVKMKVAPLYLNDWIKTYENHKFITSNLKHNRMTLMSPKGMIKDEGFFRTLKIFKNAHKKENREHFKLLRKNLAKDLKGKVEYIAIVLTK